MKKLFGALAALSVALGSTAAQAKPLVFTPASAEGATVRFNQGMATVDVKRQQGAVQVTPLGVDHGRLTFDVAVLNTGTKSDNFGVENIQASIGTQDVPVLTRKQLDGMAKKRAMWASVAVGLAAGLGAAAAASQTNRYTATTYTPHGTYHTVVTAPCTSCQVEAAAITAGGAYSVAQIQNQLDQTRAALANSIVQTTTVDPNDSYAGRIVIDKPKADAKWPQDVHLIVRFNGEEYPFTFRVGKDK